MATRGDRGRDLVLLPAMTERSLRATLKRKGWSRTDYPAVRLLLHCIRCAEPIRPCWVTGSGTQRAVHDHRDMLRRALRALRVTWTEGNDGGRMEGNWIRLDAADLKRLRNNFDQHHQV